MRFLRYPIIFFGLLSTFEAVPSRSKREHETTICEDLGDVFPGAKCKPALGPSTSPVCVPSDWCALNDTIQRGSEDSIDIRTNSCPEPNVLCKKPIPPCGFRNYITPRIIETRDNETRANEFPWMVALRRSQDKKFIGGGSLINLRVVLTAAHKLKDKTFADIIARAGEWDVGAATEQLPHQDREVETIIRHEHYNARNAHNDVAILILRTPFATAPNVNSICLPQASDNFDTQPCIASGWGKDNFDKTGEYQAQLRKVEMRVVPQGPCESNLRLTRLGQYFDLHPSFVCAGGIADRDTCTGDGGGPLICEAKDSPGRYVQVGIVSWGIGCGSDRVPGVYASVAKARNWIDEKFSHYNIDSSSYVV